MLNAATKVPFCGPGHGKYACATGRGDMYFTFRELAAVALTGSNNYFLNLQKDEGKWIIDVSVLDADKRTTKQYQVQTNRGKTKTWRYLEDALLFVNEYCENCQNLSIAIEGKVWRLKAEGEDRAVQS